jgi:phosphatidylinositol glycan class V
MYYRANPARCLRLGLWDGGANKRPDKPTPGFYSPRVFLYVVHATMLLGFGTFCMHVQVRNESVENVYVRGF